MEQALQSNQPQFDRICQKMKRLLIKKQNLTNSTPQEIIPGIFLANYTFSINKKFLNANHIGFIVTFVKIDDKDRVKGVNYKQLLIKDKPDEKINEHFDQISLIISSFLANNPERKCLINCFSGKSRSPTLLISYLINSRKISFQQAFQIVKKKYPNAQPNSGFICQLKQYEKKFKVEELRMQNRQQNNIQIKKEEKQEKQEQQKENKKDEGCLKSEQEEVILNDQKNEKEQELILNQYQNENKQEIISMNPITHMQMGEETINNQGQQNEKFQLLEGQKIQQKISSQNSAEQPPPADQQNSKIPPQEQLQKHLQKKGEQQQKKSLKFDGIQCDAVKKQEAQETRIQVLVQPKQEKDQSLQKQQNKSENEQKTETVTISEPRKKKKKNKKKKLQH